MRCPSSGKRNLWKSYLFNWRTKLAKLECLKCLGRICLANSLGSLTTKVSPSFPHENIWGYAFSSNMLSCNIKLLKLFYLYKGGIIYLNSFFTNSGILPEWFELDIISSNNNQARGLKKRRKKKKKKFNDALKGQRMRLLKKRAQSYFHA